MGSRDALLYLRVLYTVAPHLISAALRAKRPEKSGAPDLHF